MSELGNRLLYTISALGELSREKFNRIFDELYGQMRDPQNSGGLSLINNRRNASRLLDSLGHIEVYWEQNSSARVYISRPLFARLPRSGCPTFVLCGRRSPDTVQKLRIICRSFRDRALLSVKSADSDDLSPDTVELVVDSLKTAEAIASRSGISAIATPAAWSLAQFSLSLTDYMASLKWIQEPDLNWVRADFSSSFYRFLNEELDYEWPIRLSQFSEPEGFRKRYYLRRAEFQAATNPVWGRFAVIDKPIDKVLVFNSASGQVSAPLGLPLPRFLNRAMTLCSGTPPVISDHNAAANSLSRTLIYRSVPEDVCNVVRKKLDATQVMYGV